MSDPIKPADKTVFAMVGEGEAATLVIGLPQGSWEHIKDGHTVTFDLRRFGLSHRIILFGGKDRAECRSKLKADDDTLDISAIDIGFGSPE